MKNLKKIIKNSYIKILIAEILLLSFSTVIIAFNLKAKQKNVDASKKDLTIAKEENENEKTNEEVNEKENFQEKLYEEKYEDAQTEKAEKYAKKTGSKKKKLEIISGYTTEMSSDREKEKNRVYNIKKAVEYINGVELKPNEEFSFHKAVWAKNKHKCYKIADTITQNGMDKGLGGGICQVASTLFVAALKANLKIIQRNSHSKKVTYSPLGLDASYFTGVKDLKFKNILKNKIKIKAISSNDYVEIIILGKPTKEEKKIKTIIHPAKTTKENSKIIETDVLVEKKNNGETINSTHFKSSYLK